MSEDKYGFLENFLTTREIYKSRLETCRKCESFQRTVKLCKECGCFMPAKARAKSSTCPKNNW